MRTQSAKTPSKEIYALLIEDTSSDSDIVSVDAVSQLFKESPYILQTENSFENALKAVGQCLYDVILLRITGRENRAKTSLQIVQKLKEAAGDTPILLLSDTKSPEFEKQATLAGAWDCLPTCVLTCDALQRAIRYALASKRAEFDLRESDARASESETKLQLALTLSRTGVWTWHINEDRHDWDAEMLRIFGGINGYSTEIFVGLIHEDDRQRVIDAINHSRADGIDYLVEYRVIWPDQSVHWIAASGQTVRDESGTAVRMTGVCREVTRFKEQEETKRKLALLEQKQEFMTMLAHDLKAPVLSAQRIIEHVLAGSMGELPSEAHHLMNQVHKSNQSLLSLISNVMDCYRLESHQQYFLTSELDVSALLNACITQMKQLALSTDVELNCICPNKLHMLADKIAMERVICNLISNAIKFTGGGGRITVSADCENEKVVIRVEDTGIGINEKDVERIFDRFYQASSPARKSGLGLGLYLCKNLIDGQHGQITCRSTVGSGSTFEVRMPLVKPIRDLKKLTALQNP